ncbi:unnamed protein product [Phytophthora lilii]|uniref:Unnamed protein product n=1 Tax=Phytophthora lilii TaxID=2077276 RepID=A0A9W6YE30_9STRA|nr:unnamed protein product [Phytophthora lilii]
MKLHADVLAVPRWASCMTMVDVTEVEAAWDVQRGILAKMRSPAHLTTGSSAAKMTRAPVATLLFVHGGGFCKGCWDPIVRRLKDAPLLAGADFVTFDFSWHGSKYDHSVPAQVDRSNPAKPRVSHPAKDLTTWAPQEVWEQVQQIRAEQRARGLSDTTPLYGVGHSMGAMALWKTEVMHPGTFAGLSLFEPGYGIRTPENDFTVDFLVTLTLQREATWWVALSELRQS